MPYFSKIKDSSIVGALGPKYKNDFKELVNKFAEQLDGGPVLSEIGFTPHDYSRHVVDLVNIFDVILPRTFVSKDYQDSIFILLVATLFHDYGMLRKWDEETRDIHAKLGKECFLDFFKVIPENNFVQSHIPNRYKFLIADIIYAHSDCKNDGKTINHSFDEICEKYENDNAEYKGEIDHKSIDIPFLAAVLRLADELDNSQNRIRGIACSINYNTDDSAKHFRLCNLLLPIDVSRDKTTINIRPDESLLDFSADEPDCQTVSDAAFILERYEKINREFRNLSNRALRNTSHASSENWTITEIKLYNMNKLVELVKKKRIVLSVNDQIHDGILQHSLFRSGHYRLEEDRVNARDWIDLEGLFSDQNWYMDLLNGCKKDKPEIIDNKDILIGVNRYGSLVASLWGYKYNIPFSYFFDEREMVDPLERLFCTNGANNILLIVDVVVFGNTVNKVISELSSKISNDSSVEMLVLFERFTRRKKYERRYRQGYFYSNIYSNPRIQKIYIANDTFDIEICKKNAEDCPFSMESKCECCSNDYVIDEDEMLEW